VYGLAADWQSARGIRGLFAAKGREGERPVAVLFSSVEEVLLSLPDLEAEAVRVLQALLPGPFTFVVQTRVPRPPLVGTEESLGIRVPAHPGLLSLLSALGVPLAATSANLSGRPDPAALSEVDPEVLAHCCAAIVDLHGDAPNPAGTASTVVDLRPLAVGRPSLVLREGAVSAAEVEERIAEIEQPNRTQGAI
jgi:L-threonylcarbamoyladenylate synthase